MTKLSEKPLIHPTAQVTNTTLGRYTEIDEGCLVSECVIGDYSYLIRQTEAWCANIGKFANIASHVRINATNHPTWRATQHHFVYRASNYFEGESDEAEFFDWRRANAVTIGNDVWIGHGAVLLPGVDGRRRSGGRRRRGRFEGHRSLHDRRRRTGKADPRALSQAGCRAHGRAGLVGLGSCPACTRRSTISGRSKSRHSWKNTPAEHGSASIPTGAVDCH